MPQDRCKILFFYQTTVSLCFRIIREVGKTLGIPLFVFGPETHMTAIVGMALGKKEIPSETSADGATANFLLPGGQEQVRELNNRKVLGHYFLE
jgi:hypothetical protein